MQIDNVHLHSIQYSQISIIYQVYIQFGRFNSGPIEKGDSRFSRFQGKISDVNFVGAVTHLVISETDSDCLDMIVKSSVEGLTHTDHDLLKHPGWTSTATSHFGHLGKIPSRFRKEKPATKFGSCASEKS
jgi:hypothetical protein